MFGKKPTKKQKESIVFDYGILVANYGVTTQKYIGPLSGGGKVEHTIEIYDIPYEGKKGKEKGLQVVVGSDAKVTTNIMDVDLETLKSMVMPWATYTEGASPKIAVGEGNIGVIPDDAYLENITLFVKILKGQYKKITLFNAMNEIGFSLEAKDGAEGMVPVELYAHWCSEDTNEELFTIEDIATIADPPAAG